MICPKKEPNMCFDDKEELMFEHYKKVLANDEFDEYDILGFLIFIRRHMKGSRYKLIIEFADLVAHRGRDRGMVMDAIKGAIKHSYQTEPGSKHIKGYHGIDYDDWKATWETLGKEYHIDFTDKRISDITVCIFSLAQYTVYDDGTHKGRIELFQQNQCELFLATRENKNRSPYINFAICPSLIFSKEYPAGHIPQPVETVRIRKKLRLRDISGFII
jgi:hypothetical protein